MMRYRNSRNAVAISIIIWLTVSCMSSISLKFRYIEPAPKDDPCEESLNTTKSKDQFQSNNTYSYDQNDFTCKSVMNLTDGEDCYW